MPADPTLEALMAGGNYAIAADRYEDEPGDAELAALLRIDGLEWRLVDGVPALALTAKLCTRDRWSWWELRCGRHDFGLAYPFNNWAGRPTKPEPFKLTPLAAILASARLPANLADRFYRVYCDAVHRECNRGR